MKESDAHPPSQSSQADSAFLLAASERRQRFVKQVSERIFYDFFGRQIYQELLYRNLAFAVAHATGVEFHINNNLSFYIDDDFGRCQKALVACSHVLAKIHDQPYARQLDELIREVVTESGLGLGVRWEQGQFVRTGKSDED